MARTLTFPTASSLNADTTYAQPAMAGQGLLDNDRLRLSFAPLAGRDYIRFTVPIAALAPGLSGSYKLLDQRHSAGAVAEIFYTFGVARNPASTGSFLVSGAEHATRGQLLVTSCDASRRLLSGSFEMAIDNMQNLTDRFSVPNAPPLCNLRVTGAFANLKLK